MAPGTRDSSKTRVVPVFDQLWKRDPTGRSWLPRLLSLPAHGTASTAPANVGVLRERNWGPDERGLCPPVSLLSWLIRHLEQPSGGQTEPIDRRRIDLMGRDPATIQQALSLLRAGASERKWYVFEGVTFPDVFLATDDLVVVVDGKRTEAGPTTATKWMPVRHQMLRHLDCAYEIIGHRQLLGFFIVEGDPAGQVPQPWVDACKATTSSEVLQRSLPHRSEEERLAIANCFLGATTWQRVCSELGLAYESLPDQSRHITSR